MHHGETFADVYQNSLIELMTDPEYHTRPRDMLVNENTNVALQIGNPLSCLYNTEARSSMKKYIAAELLWYFMGRRGVEFISKYAKFWKSIDNGDGTVNSAYGYLLFKEYGLTGITQYEWAYNSLIEDKDTRQAIMHFNMPKHQYEGNKDFVCTLTGIFQIRDNCLNLSINMRSNDVIWGLPTDLVFFVILQSQMLSHLKTKYPDLKMGSYTHYAHSYHIYEKHFEQVTDMINLPFKSENIPSVGLDLIDVHGNATSDFQLLFKNYEETDTLYEDPLYSWIHQNLK